MVRESTSTCAGWRPRETLHDSSNDNSRDLSRLQFPALVSDCESVLSFNFIIGEKALHEYRVNHVVAKIHERRRSVWWGVPN